MNNKILSIIKNMEDNEIRFLWNEYCYASNNYDDEILDAYQLEEYSNGLEPLELVNRFFYGEDAYNDNSGANPNRDYFMFNGYGNIISFDYIYNEYTDKFFRIDIESLVDYIIDNEESFGVYEIEEALNE